MPANDPFAPGLLPRLPAPPRKVAIVRASRIGDFICATPAFRALRAALPGAEITLIALPFNRDLVVRSPYLDRFEPFPGYPGMAEQFFDARAAVAFFARMQATRCDLALQLHGSGANSNPFTLLLGARVTAGFVRPGDGPGRLDAALPFPETGYEVDRVLALTTFLGAPDLGTETEFPLWPEDHTTAERLLSGAARPLIGLHPGTWDLTKRWPPERFAAVAHALRQRFGGTVVLLGSEGERDTAGQVARDGGAPLLDLSGRTSLPVLGAVIARLAVLVTNDSGPAHIGYALGTPTVTVFGSTDPSRWAARSGDRHRALAYSVPCRPCDYAVCPIGSACLRGVTVEQVVAAASAIARPPSSARPPRERRSLAM